MISHRRNTIEQLVETPVEYGIEIDIRSFEERLVIHHDPFDPGVDFCDWMGNFCHKTLILNVKEEGLEDRLLGLMTEFGVSDFFFLDQSFPFLIKTAKSGERRCAVRLSEFESIETVSAVAPMIDWVWIDSFTKLPLDHPTVEALRDMGIKTCIVSPELQGRTDTEEVDTIRAEFSALDFKPTAVCTKAPLLWK